MAFQPNDDLDRAIKALTLFRVWQSAYAEGAVLEPAPAAMRDGQFKSPFREDGKKGSFSVCHQGSGFKDFGGNGESGGVWKFAAMCWPNLQKPELAKRLIELSGIIPTSPSSSPPAGPGVVDPALKRAAQAIERKSRVAAAENAAYQDREEALHTAPAKPTVVWPACVAEHFEEGLTYLQANPKDVDEIATARGWPTEWAWALYEMGQVSYPLERWAIPGEKWSRRQKAFVVQAPRERGGEVSLAAVGYHQRMYVPASGGKPEQKGWIYVPSLPNPKDTGQTVAGTARSPLEKGIVAAAVERMGAEAVEDRPSLVPPLPFVLGDVQAPRLIVLLEGQWDAISFFGACGWFHDTTPAEGIAVFGIRGAQGTEAFLAHWGAWLARVKPRAWVIADNDAAGGSWREAPPAEPGLPRPPSLSERLVAAGCRQPLVSWLKPGPWGKDFNDYYRVAKPDVGKMMTWMRRVGVMGDGGLWT